MDVKKYLYIAICILFCHPLYGQDIEGVTNEVKAVVKTPLKEAVKINGGINANTTFYTANGIESRRDPFFWMLNANLNISLYGKINIPFTLSFSQQENRLTRPYVQPFNIVGLSPKYKWITAHLGYRSMSFSELTLGGNRFLGAGVELSPPKSIIKFSAMYGRFQKAVAEEGGSGVISGRPMYERWGYGAKLTVGKKNRELSVILFRAIDDSLSIPSQPIGSGVKPQENLVWSLHGKAKVAPKTSIDIEYALSAFTDDIRDEKLILERFTYANNMGRLFTPRLSSEFNNALVAKLQHNGEAYQLQLGYRRIDPGYQTMGAAFFNNDIEDITTSLAWAMLNQRINVSLTGGFQRNNLRDNQSASTARTVGSINMAIAATQKLNLNFTYANFNSTTKINKIFNVPVGTPIAEIDTLNFFQETQNANATAMYNLGGQKMQSSLMLMGNYQGANDSEGSKNAFYNANFAYNMSFTQIGLVMGWAINYTHNDVGGINTQNIGPSFNMSKSFAKGKVRSNLGANWLQSSADGEAIGEYLTLLAGLTYSFLKKHSIATRFNYLNSSSTLKEFSEFRASINYGFRF